MISVSSRLRMLLDAERAAVSALRRLADEADAPELRACLEELHDATLWLCDGLVKHIPPATRRRSRAAGVLADLTEQVMRVPAVVDRLRLLNRHQRSVLVRIDGLLHERLDGDLRALLQAAHVIIGRTVAGFDDTISGLDREREVRREADECLPGGSL